MSELVEPIATLTFGRGPTDAFLARGMRTYWDGYFAGRAAPLGIAPAEVVHTVLYNFADGEVARHAGSAFTDEGRALRERMEALTDGLAAQAYEVLTAAELDELVAGLEPIAATI